LEKEIMKYIKSDALEIKMSKPDSTFVSFEVELIYNAVISSRKVFQQLASFDSFDFFDTLGMRNLSGFIGEVVVKQIEKQSSGFLEKNPHQDGYPDLILLDERGKEDIKNFSLYDKKPFSPFINGGIEVKCSCGMVPTDKKCKEMGLIHKPEIGESRQKILTGYDWKSHHRQTNNLLGLLWDFDNGVPAIIACFYSNALIENDWGKVVQPKPNSRTTSVSTMNRSGIKKMYDGCLFFRDDEFLISFLDKYNKSNSLSLIKNRQKTNIQKK
tara:strand:+ start:84 stop:893 length:810 start_codon:yes stop_codon:yes gene_type:complete